MPASQAGRRGFEPRLPLHKINNLKRSASQACSKMLQNYPVRRNEVSKASTATLRLATDFFV